MPPPPRPRSTSSVIAADAPQPTPITLPNNLANATPQQILIPAIKGRPISRQASAKATLVQPEVQKIRDTAQETRGERRRRRSTNWKVAASKVETPQVRRYVSEEGHHDDSVNAEDRAGVYGVVPGRTDKCGGDRVAMQTVRRRGGGGSVTMLPELASAQTTTLTITSTAIASHHDDLLPDPPIWIIWLLAGAMTAGFACAILLYFVNFPPKLRFGRRDREVRRQYALVKQNEEGGGVERDGLTASATCVDGPLSLLARRRRSRGVPRSLSVDTAASYKGLGLAVPGREAVTEPSPFNGSSSSLVTLAGKAQPSAASLIPISTSDDAAYEVQRRKPDLEDGLLSPNTRRKMSPDESPAASSSSSSSHSSSTVRLLEKVNDGIEYAADKFARILHDQVRGDAEEGLWLPVRDSERERDAQMKNLY